MKNLETNKQLEAMADPNDTRNLSGQLERQFELLEQADVEESDREAIRAFAEKRASELTTGSLTTYLSRLRKSAERAVGGDPLPDDPDTPEKVGGRPLPTDEDGNTVNPVDKPLLAFEHDRDVTKLQKLHEAHGTHSTGSLNTHTSALSQFFEWLYRHADPSYDWLEDRDQYRFYAHIPRVKDADNDESGVQPRDIPTLEEVAAMEEAAPNYRDAAIVAFMGDVGHRVQLTTQIKRGDVDLDGFQGQPTFRPNDQGSGQKDTPIKDYLLRDSRGALQEWLNHHPDDHDDAPVFASLRDYTREDGAIHPSTVAGRLELCAERAAEMFPDRAADIENRDIRPHIMRYHAALRMRKKYGMEWDDIGDRAGWEDSSLDQMKQIYKQIDNSDELQRQFNVLYGDDDETASVSDEPTETECWNCGTMVSADKQYCGDCGQDVTIAPEKVEMAKESVRQNFQTLLAEADRETIEEVTRDVFGSAVDYIDRIEETD